jgi:hypothetical protein
MIKTPPYHDWECHSTPLFSFELGCQQMDLLPHPKLSQHLYTINRRESSIAKREFFGEMRLNFTKKRNVAMILSEKERQCADHE